MARLDVPSGLLFALSVSAAAAIGYGVSHMGDRGRAQAAPVPSVAAPMQASVHASGPAPASGRPAQITRAADGHYWAEADINGRAVRVLVDTGASVVALTRDDALRLGFMLQSEDFDQTVLTANGEGRAARVELAHVAVAGARVERVQALVVERGLPASLLGMSYLGRLSRMEATPHGLTLRP